MRTESTDEHRYTRMGIIKDRGPMIEKMFKP
jgi:hypothetical protein